MKERPILFKADMVNAILEGRKTQTRRVIKSPVEIRSRGDLRFSEIENDWEVYGAGGVYLSMPCPYGKPGDRLWVRETFWEHTFGGQGSQGVEAKTKPDGSHQCIAYKASNAIRNYLSGKVRPSIHMPRWASRITLEITDVRVERLNDISEEDAQAEGADCLISDNTTPEERELLDFPLYENGNPYRNGFAFLWESINGPGSWEENPWVWVVEFKHV